MCQRQTGARVERERRRTGPAVHSAVGRRAGAQALGRAVRSAAGCAPGRTEGHDRGHRYRLATITLEPPKPVLWAGNAQTVELARRLAVSTMITPRKRYDSIGSVPVCSPRVRLGLWPLERVPFVAEFTSGCFAIKLPVDFDAISVHSSVPRPRFLSQDLETGDSSLT